MKNSNPLFKLSFMKPKLKIKKGLYYLNCNNFQINCKKILFLDRDGVINEDFGYVHLYEDIVYIKGIFKFCKKAVDHGYLICIVTNQAGIAKGLYDIDDFILLSEQICEDFLKFRIPVWRIYFSPYHVQGIVSPFKKNHQSRKPGNLLFDHAISSSGANKNQCIMIGDRSSDLKAAKKSKVPKRHLITNSSGFEEIRI